METIRINTSKHCELIDITSKVETVLKKSKVKNGFCIVFCPHTTAGLTINENADPSVKKDMLGYLERSVPANAGYSHSEGNSDGHIKGSLMGSSLNIIIEDNILVLGTWQGIYFCEFDGPRSREVYVKIVR